MEVYTTEKLLSILKEAGYKVLEVYDGFYTNCKDTELLENIYKTTALEIIDNI